MQKLLFLSLLMPACISGRILIDECNQEFDAGGMHFCSAFETEDYVPQLIDSLIGVIEKESQVYYPKVTNLKQTLKDKGVVVTLIKNHLAKDCQVFYGEIYKCEFSLNGFNVDGSSIVVNYKDCNSLSSISHEVLHSIEQFYLWGGTYKHTTPNVFNETNKETSIERMVQLQVSKWCWGPNGVANDP